MTLNDFTPVGCPMPACGAPLELARTIGYQLSAADLTTTIAPGPEQHAATWDIRCHEGHVILVPGPAGCCDDNGTRDCTHDEDDFDSSEDVRTFRDHDLDRLRTVLDHIGGPR